LGSSEKDRKENIRRTGEVVKLMLEAGIITLVAMISPYVLDNPRRGGDPAMLVASSEKAKKLLNLKFKFQSLESIIKTIL
jgi:UDP-glucose 4-epimerase